MDTTLLIVGDVEEELNEIISQISSDYSDIHTALDDETGLALFDEHEPQILLLCHESPSLAERFYLSLFRNSKKVHVTPHLGILLCQASDSATAYKLCSSGTFDDYVAYKPTYDVNRIKMSIRLAVEKLDRIEESASSYSQLAPHSKVVTELLETFEQSVSQGEQAKNDSSRVYDELENGIESQIDRLAGQLLQNKENIGTAGLVENLLSKFKQENLKPEFVKAHEQMDGAMEQWVRGSEQALGKFSEPVRDFNTFVSNIPKYILVIEDDEIFIELLKDFLEEEGFHVLFAQDGEQGLGLAAKLHPDLILLDFNLPSMSGISVLQKARQMESLEKAPFIILTGESRREIVEEAIKSGANDFAVKPISLDTLLEKINNCLGKQID